MIDHKTAEQIIKLSQNENAYGPSPMAMKAVSEQIKSMNRYPEPHSTSLKAVFAKHHNRNPNNIFVSAGLVEALDIMIRNFIKKDENLVIPKLTFVAYRLLAEVFGIETRFSKMKDYRIDIDEMIEISDDKTKVIIIANPNNPTGNIITQKELIRLLKSVSSNTIVAVDEAYCEYVSHEDYPTSLELQKYYPNLIILRTFSKIYGLAGVRVGYVIANRALIKKFEYYQAPFTVNRIASVAAASAINDKKFVNNSFEMNLQSRNLLEKELLKMGYKVVPSQSNFLFIHFDNQEERDSLFDLLGHHKVVGRKMGPFGDFKAFRITIPKPEYCQKIVDCFKEYRNMST